MFEQNIDEGMEISVFENEDDPKTGKSIKVKKGTQWKIRFKCSGCGEIIDECFCFSTKEKMLKAKEKPIYCDLICKLKNEPNYIDEYFEILERNIPEIIKAEKLKIIEEYIDFFDMDEDICEYLDSDQECSMG